MSKYVSDSKAAKSIRAILILKKGKPVAKLLSYHADSGGVLVNVFQHGKALERSAKARKIPLEEARAHDGKRQLNFQHNRAGGYGYDKFTAALRGMIIDGHEMTDHCGARLPFPNGLSYFPRDWEAPKGYSVANYHTAERMHEYTGKPLAECHEGFSDCYRQSGLDYLRDIGYSIEEVL